MAQETLTAEQLNRATLARQLLLQREKISALDAVQRLVAMQAQVARPPFVGLWTRVHNFARADLSQLLHDRQVVRATTLRGTLHIMSSADFVALRGALQPALTRGLTARGEGARALDLAALEKAGRAFFARSPATFDALRDHLKAKQPSADERALAYAIRVYLPLVQVPTDAPWAFPAAADFTLADAWLGQRVSNQDAPAHELVRRYLAAFGPATVADAQAWSALNGLRETFEDLRPELVTFRDARKRELFDLPDAPRPAADTPVPVRFLPEFDNLVLSHDDRTRVISDQHRGLVVTRNLQVRATFLVDGFVAGAWKIERKKKNATLTLEPFVTLNKKTRAALDQEGQALLQFSEDDAAVREVRYAG